MELPDFFSEKRSIFRELQLVFYKPGKVPAALLDDDTSKNLYKKGQIGFFRRIKGPNETSYEPMTLTSAVLIATAYAVEAWDKYKSTLSLSSSGPFVVFGDSNDKLAEGELHFDEVSRALVVGGVALQGAKRQQYLICQIANEDKPIIIKSNSTLQHAINLSVRKVYKDNNKKPPSFFWPSMLCSPGQRWIFSQKTDADGLPVFVTIDKEGNRAKDKGDVYFMPHLIAEYVGDKVQSVEQVYNNIKGLFV